LRPSAPALHALCAVNGGMPLVDRCRAKRVNIHRRWSALVSLYFHRLSLRRRRVALYREGGRGCTAVTSCATLALWEDPSGARPDNPCTPFRAFPLLLVLYRLIVPVPLLLLVLLLLLLPLVVLVLLVVLLVVLLLLLVLLVLLSRRGDPSREAEKSLRAESGPPSLRGRAPPALPKGAEPPHEPREGHPPPRRATGTADAASKTAQRTLPPASLPPPLPPLPSPLLPSLNSLLAPRTVGLPEPAKVRLLGSTCCGLAPPLPLPPLPRHQLTPTSLLPLTPDFLLSVRLRRTEPGATAGAAGGSQGP